MAGNIQDSGGRMPCILCGKEHPDHYYTGKTGREYLRCPCCGLVFLRPDQRPSPEEEFSRYQRHQNSPEDHGYQEFLRKLADPLDSMLQQGSEGLDFGSGPVPVLSSVLASRGHRMKIYDPFFADDQSVFEKDYDFITAAEVVEHLFNPGEELDRLWGCLRKGGYLGIMTELLPAVGSFESWYYKDDRTHVTFFSGKTFGWLQRRWEACLEYEKDNVLIFKKID